MFLYFVSEIANTRSDQPFIFRVSPATSQSDRAKLLEVAAENADDLAEWITAIRDAALTAADRVGGMVMFILGFVMIVYFIATTKTYTRTKKRYCPRAVRPGGVLQNRRHL
jgi:hypothetical protein